VRRFTTGGAPRLPPKASVELLVAGVLLFAACQNGTVLLLLPDNSGLLPAALRAAALEFAACLTNKKCGHKRVLLSSTVRMSYREAAAAATGCAGVVGSKAAAM
jgi:hypothetical protein